MRTLTEELIYLESLLDAYKRTQARKKEALDKTERGTAAFILASEPLAYWNGMVTALASAIAHMRDVKEAAISDLLI